MKRRAASGAGFSLVEVTLALGISSFCLLTILGLLTAGLTTNQVSTNQTASNGILSTIIADLRATRPPDTGETSVKSPRFSIPIPTNPVTVSPTDTTFYVNEEGQFVTAKGTDSLYRVTITFLPNDATRAKSATYALVKVSWPASATPDSALGYVNTFVALDRN